MNLSDSGAFSKRRDRLNIIAEILGVARDGALKTQIMYGANLSFTQLTQYLGIMVKSRLLERIMFKERQVYKTTEKGFEFLQMHRAIKNLLKTKSNDNKDKTGEISVNERASMLKKELKY